MTKPDARCSWRCYVYFALGLLMAAIYVTVKADVFSVHRNGTP